MIKINQKRQRGKRVFFFLLVLLVFGCSTEKAAKKDPFFEKWDVAAKESMGHSPVPRNRIVIFPGTKEPETKAGEGEAVVKEGAPLKSLPTEKVNLKMRQSDVKAVIRALARASGKNVLIKNDIKGEINVDFTDVPWDQAFNSILNAHGLSYLWDGDIIRVLSLDDMEQSLKISAINERRKAQEVEVKRVETLVTMVVSVDYAESELLKENLQEFLTKDKEGKTTRGSVKVDKHSNSLIIQAIREDIDRMIPIIEKIDKPTPQINIKANIIETTKETARDLGIQWGGMYGHKFGDESFYITPGGSGGLATSPTGPFSGVYNPVAGAAGISGQGFGVNMPAANMGTTAAASLGLMFGTIGGNILELQLSALQRDSKINILSSPSITTLDNQMAFTANGERIPYVTTVQGSGGTTTQEVKFEDVVLRLEITPHVIDGKNLKMKIVVKKDEVDPVRNVQGNPYILKKETQTNLIVADGETIVISGLSKQRNADTDKGVPGLKDIPVLGWFFKNEGKSDQMQEVLIFITPTILPPQVTAAAGEGADKAGTAGH